MNKLEYYTRQKEIWDIKEVEQLQREYSNDLMTIISIADIHRRTPGSIAYKLKNLDLISHSAQSRGYTEYRQSDLYNEIIQTSHKIQAEHKVKKENKLNDKKKILERKTEMPELNDIRDEIKELKMDIKEMLRLMNALYDFESK